MKVYVKKGEVQSITVSIIITALLLAFSIGITIYAFKYNNFIEALENLGIGLLVAIIFFITSIYLIYMLIKPSTKFVGKLISKEVEQYNNKRIVYMAFEVNKKTEDLIASTYYCYTLEDNNLKINNKYIVYIKKINWQIKKIEEATEYLIQQKSVKKELPSMLKMSSLFKIISLFFIFNLIMSIYGTIFYKKYYWLYIVILILNIYILLFIKKKIKIVKKDESGNKYEILLNKYKILNNDNKKIKNPVIKHLIIQLFIVFVIWLLLVLILTIMGNNIIESIFYLQFLIIVPSIGLFIKILFYINYDSRLMKKYNLSPSLKNINNVKSFKIFRPTLNTSNEKYLLVEQNNLLYNVQGYGLNYFVYDAYNNKIALIQYKISNDGYIVRPIGEKPFFVRAKLGYDFGYDTSGLNYTISGNINRTDNVIYDNNKNEVAIVSLIENEYGNTNVMINDNIITNINIVLICICITIGNFRYITQK